MKRSRLLWPIAGISALLSTLLFVFGFSYAVLEILNPNPEQQKIVSPSDRQTNATQSPNKIQILALGDSLTKGVGDEAGEGYVGKVKRELEKTTDKPVYVWNYAVNGARTQQLLTYLEAKSSADYVQQADIILLTIGGNDLNQFVSAAGTNGGNAATSQAAPGLPRSSKASSSSPTEAVNPSTANEAIAIPYEEIKKKLPEVLTRFDTIIAKLSEMNPKASIIYVGLYHPYLDYDAERKGSTVIQEWNYRAFQIANKYPNVTVVPTFDVFQNHLKEMLFGDHFHPNGRGYEIMAERVMQVLQ